MFNLLKRSLLGYFSDSHKRHNTNNANGRWLTVGVYITFTHGKPSTISREAFKL